MCDFWDRNRSAVMVGASTAVDEPQGHPQAERGQGLDGLAVRDVAAPGEQSPGAEHPVLDVHPPLLHQLLPRAVLVPRQLDRDPAQVADDLLLRQPDGDLVGDDVHVAEGFHALAEEPPDGKPELRRRLHRPLDEPAHRQRGQVQHHGRLQPRAEVRDGRVQVPPLGRHRVRQRLLQLRSPARPAAPGAAPGTHPQRMPTRRRWSSSPMIAATDSSALRTIALCFSSE